jgi:hypothetical protein
MRGSYMNFPNYLHFCNMFPHELFGVRIGSTFKLHTDIVGVKRHFAVLAIV